MVSEAEGLIDRYMAEVELPPKFVIPGGNQLSAQLDVGRAVIRRAERGIAALAEAGELASETVIHFVNRASDLAYAMARFADVDDPALFEGRGKG
jgi:cob(I)alamin adenosyltransferase